MSEATKPNMPPLSAGQFWEVVLEDSSTYWNAPMYRNQPFLTLKENVTVTAKILGIFPVKREETVTLQSRPLISAKRRGDWNNYPIVYDWKSITPEDIEATAQHILDFLEAEKKQKEIASALLVKYPPKLNYYTLKDDENW